MMKIKKTFLWSRATVANQYEGAYDEEGRGISNEDFIPSGKIVFLLLVVN